MVDAAKLLQITVQQTASLLRHGILKAINGDGRAVRITEKSLRELHEIVSSPFYVSLSEAAERLSYDEHKFCVYFVETGIVNVLDLKFWRLIHIDDIANAESVNNSRITANEAGKLLGMHRSFLPNLERQGGIKSQLLGAKRAVKFYSRESIRQMTEKLEVDFKKDGGVRLELPPLSRAPR